MFHLTLDLELHDPIKELNKKRKDKFILEQDVLLKEIFSRLNGNNLSITCFVTNEFVENFYDFFHKYILKSHEVGCHTTNHLFYTSENLAEFVDSIEKNKAYLEKETGLTCQGFRAPGGIVPISLIEILKKLGFKYDSSIVPGRMPGRFNYSRAPKNPYFPDFDNIFLLNKNNKKIIEFPLLTSKILKLSMNGVFFGYYNNFIDINKYEKKYAAVYLHPCDFKKFNIFEKAYFWDKIKNTKSYWRFLDIFVQTNKNKDTRLCKLYNTLTE